MKLLITSWKQLAIMLVAGSFIAVGFQNCAKPLDDSVVDENGVTSNPSTPGIDDPDPTEPDIVILNITATQVMNAGDDITIEVEAQGDGLEYAWSFEGGNPFATTASHTITNLQVDDTGTYSVLITDQYGKTATDSVSIAVNSLASLAFSPTTVGFGTVEVGDIENMSVTLTNSGALAATSLSLNGLAAPFTVLGSSNCGATLAAGAACTVNLRFTPTANGVRNDTLTANFTTNGSAGSSSITMSGTGNITIIPADLLRQSGNLSFGTVSVGATGTRTYTIVNNGGSSATGMSISVSGAGYSRNGGTCASTLAMGATCTIIVNFSPASAGSMNGSFVINYNNALAADSYSDNLSGTGQIVVLDPANITLTSGNPNFGFVFLGNTRTRTLTYTNGGEVTATGMSHVLSGSSNFTRTGGTCGTSLAAGASCTHVVRFSSAIGISTATLTINYSGTSVSTTLTGEGEIDECFERDFRDTEFCP